MAANWKGKAGTYEDVTVNGIPCDFQAMASGDLLAALPQWIVGPIFSLSYIVNDQLNSLTLLRKALGGAHFRFLPS